MSDINKRIERIKFLLNESYQKMNGITDDTFTSTFAEVKTLLEESQEHKYFILSKYSPTELKAYEPELTKLTKHVAELFDNIIEKKNNELMILANRIKFVQNQKKLVNYHR